MNRSILRRLILGVLVTGLCAQVIGCGWKPTGKWVANGGLLTVEFKGDKAVLSAPIGPSETCDYTVDGDKEIVKSKSQGDIEFTHMKDGTMQGNGMTFTKS